ncbi:hypothetical protein ANAPC5_01421 [Anaplasma phagocytophilum]|nr:hypothetical protein ANAPC5_01421 [Anaplasma phagocytophilum]
MGCLNVVLRRPASLSVCQRRPALFSQRPGHSIAHRRSALAGGTQRRLAPLKALLHTDAERSERSAAQNVGLSLAGEQELDTCDQSLAVSAALLHVCYARTSEYNRAFSITKRHPGAASSD